MSNPAQIKITYNIVGQSNQKTQTLSQIGSSDAYSGNSGDFFFVRYLLPAPGTARELETNNRFAVGDYPTPGWTMVKNDSDPAGLLGTLTGPFPDPNNPGQTINIEAQVAPL